MSQELYYYSPDNGTSWEGPFDAQQMNELRASGVVQPSFPIYSDAGRDAPTAPQYQSVVPPPMPPQGGQQSAVYPQPQGYPQGIPQIQGYVQPPVDPTYTPSRQSEPSPIRELFIVKFDGRMRRQKFWISQFLFSLISIGSFVHLVIVWWFLTLVPVWSLRLAFGRWAGVAPESWITLVSVPFWMLCLYVMLVGLLLSYFVLVGFGMAVRRLHDIGKSGRMVLLGAIPIIGWIHLLIMLYCTDSQRRTNKWGPNPME